MNCYTFVILFLHFMTLKAFMVVAQLVVQSLQTPEVRPSIPVIDKLYTVNWISYICVLFTWLFILLFFL